MCVKAVLAVADLKRKDVNLELIKARARARPRPPPPPPGRAGGRPC